MTSQAKLPPKFPDIKALTDHLSDNESKFNTNFNYKRITNCRIKKNLMSFELSVYSPLAKHLCKGGKFDNKPFRGLTATLKVIDSIYRQAYKQNLHTLSIKTSNPYSTYLVSRSKRKLSEIKKFICYKTKLSLKLYKVDVSEKDAVLKKCRISEPSFNLVVSPTMSNPLVGAFVETIALADQYALILLVALRNKEITASEYTFLTTEIQKQFSSLYNSLVNANRKLPDHTTKKVLFLNKIGNLNPKEIDQKFFPIDKILKTATLEAPLYL